MKISIPYPPNLVKDFKRTRRQFITSSVIAISTGLLSSCSNDNPDPIVPEPKPEPELDKTLAFIGDSMTASAGGSQPYGVLVGKALDNRPVVVEAIGGQTSVQIAARQGGNSITISVEGNAFNGTESVKIKKISNEFLSTSATTKEQVRKGMINEVKCTISRVGQTSPAAEVYTVKPDASSSASIPENSIVTLDNAAKMKTATQILWMGRNDVGSKTIVEDVTKSVEQCVAFIAEPKRFVVLGILPSVAETKATPFFTSIAETNSKLQSKYGNQFLPMLPPTQEEMTAVGYVATELDKTQIENGVFPRGLRIDSTHFTNAGYQIVANRVIARLKELKY